MNNPVQKFYVHIVRIIILLNACLLLGLFLNGTPAWACSCFPHRSPQEELAESAVVFSGQVIQINNSAQTRGFFGSEILLTVTFNVYEIWKGPQENPIVIKTTPNSASCGFNFEVGQEYLIYAFGSKSNLQTNICTRTTTLANAAGDLHAIGTGAVAPPLRDAQNPLSINWLLGISILLLVIALVSILIVVLYRSKSEEDLS
jgi:hypothetical protein